MFEKLFETLFISSPLVYKHWAKLKKALNNFLNVTNDIGKDWANLMTLVKMQV